ncbi:MAG: hypothetical protein ACK5OC_07995 [Pirellula sp.]|jgi:hypothetical protein
MKPIGILSAHFAAGVLTTCLVGTAVLYGLQSWKRFSSSGSTEIVELGPDVAMPRIVRTALAPIDIVDHAAFEVDAFPRSVSESELTVDGQIELLSAEYNASKNEATRQRLSEQLSILKNSVR